MPRRLHVSVALGTVGLATAAALSAPTVAQAAPTVVVGDVTGDGVRDRTTLATTGTAGAATCVAQVRVGKADGTFAAARPVVLDTPENREDGALQGCPDQGIVLTGTRPGLARLAVVYTTSPFTDSRGVSTYDLTGAAVRTGSVPRTTTFGAGYGGAFGTADFDGNGNADFWRQGTDEGEGSAFWQRRGDQFTLVYRTGYNPGIYTPGSGFQFIDLNLAGGTDVLVSTIGSGPSRAAVVDGRTGAVQTLASGFPDDAANVYGYSIATVDLNHDRYPDIAVQPLADDGTAPAPRYFLNRSQGGRWSFTPYGAAPASS